MAFRLLLRQRAIAPVAATVVGGATIVAPWRTVHAEAPPASPAPKKPIYDDPVLFQQPPKTTKPTPSTPDETGDTSSSSPNTPTPTDRLATQIRHARLFIHRQSRATESSFNDLMTWLLRNESSLADTVSSLAPSRESGEQLLPGGIYVLVSAMAGSIVSRNRNILIRATFPLAVGVTAGWMLIPVTMRNVGDLVWGWEKLVPGVAETHGFVRGAGEEAWRQTKVHGEGVGRWIDGTVSGVRGEVEGWVSKGK